MCKPCIHSFLNWVWKHLTKNQSKLAKNLRVDPEQKTHANRSSVLSRGYREALDGRLCRPDSEGRPLISNLTTVAIVKLCCHNFTQIANFMIFFVSTISYRPIDLSLLKEFSKNVTFWKFYIFHWIIPKGGHWLAILLLWL